VRNAVLSFDRRDPMRQNAGATVTHSDYYSIYADLSRTIKVGRHSVGLVVKSAVTDECKTVPSGIFPLPDIP